MAITSYAPKVVSPRIWRRDGAPTFWAYLDAPGRTFAGDSGDVYDLAGNTPAGSRVGGCTRADGPRGKVLSFNGSTGYVDIGTPPALNLAGDLTLSAWIAPTTVSATMGVAASCRSDGAELQWGLEIGRTAGCIGFLQYPTFIGHSNAILSANVRQHVAVTRKGSGSSWTISYYLNGVLDSTQPCAVPVPPTHPVAIGRPGASSGQYFSGTIDDVRAWPRALSAAEVARDFADPDWRLRRTVAARTFARGSRPPMTSYYRRRRIG